MAHNLSNITLDDILQNPQQFGMPSFEEFQANPDKYRKSNEEMLTCMEQGSQMIRGVVKKHRYEFEGIKVDTAEQLQRIMRDEGLLESEVTWCPEVVPLNDGSGKCDILHKIKRKSRLILP